MSHHNYLKAFCLIAAAIAVNGISSFGQTRAPVAGGLGLVKGDNVPLYASSAAAEPGKEQVFKNMIVKILRAPPGSKRIEIESEVGKGWIDSGQVARDFDREAAKKTYETKLGMAWFFERFNEGTNYETMSFETEEFSTDEYRALIQGAQVGAEGEKEPAQIVIARTILEKLKKPKSDWSSRERYFAKAVDTADFWLKIQSSSREFWSALPQRHRSDREMLLKLIPNGAYLIYDQLSDKLKGDPELAKAAFKRNPEALQHASEKIRDLEEVVLLATLQNPLMIEHASKRLRDNEDLFKKIAAVNAMSIQFASERLQKKPDFISHVCAFRPWAIQYAAPEVRDNESVFLAIAPKNPMVIKLASDRLRNNLEFLKKMYAAAPEGYKEMFYGSFPAEMRHRIDSP
jgi:hypothetical protein